MHQVLEEGGHTVNEGTRVQVSPKDWSRYRFVIKIRNETDDEMSSQPHVLSCIAHVLREMLGVDEGTTDRILATATEGEVVEDDQEPLNEEQPWKSRLSAARMIRPHGLKGGLFRPISPKFRLQR